MTLRTLSKRTLLALAIGIPGCVVYDNNCDPDQKDPLVSDSGVADAGDEGQEGPLLLVDPDTVEVGETLIAAVVMDPDSPEPLAFQTVAEVRFSAGIAVCSEQARDGELLLSLVVDDAAEPGPVDLMLILDDGERVVVPDALEILDAGLVGGAADDDDLAPDGEEAEEDDPGGGFVEEGEAETDDPGAGGSDGAEDDPLAGPQDPCR